MTTSHEHIESATDTGEIAVDQDPVYIPPCDHADQTVVGQGHDTAEDGSVEEYVLTRCNTCGHEAVQTSTGSTT